MYKIQVTNKLYYLQAHGNETYTVSYDSKTNKFVVIDEDDHDNSCEFNMTFCTKNNNSKSNQNMVFKLFSKTKNTKYSKTHNL